MPNGTLLTEGIIQPKQIVFHAIDVFNFFSKVDIGLHLRFTCGPFKFQGCKF